MTDPMSPEELRACRERAEAATAGALSVAREDEEHGAITYAVVRGGLTLAFVPEDTRGKWEKSSAKADAAFWASARADVLRLLATIAALQARTEKAEEKAQQYERDWYDAKAEFGGAIQARDEQIARLSAACELDDIATTREMACTTRLFGHDHPEFHDLSHAEWVTELLNAYEMVCHAALFAYGCRGGPGAWRWASDPTGTTLGDVAAWERLLRELAPSGDGGEGGAS